MKRTHYAFGIFFLGLSALCGVAQSIIHFRLEEGIYFLQHFAHWYLVLNIISIAAIAFVLNYLRVKGYSVSFMLGVVATVFLVCQVVGVYIILVLVLREVGSLGIVLVLPFLLLSIAFATSLIFSRAAERIWLKSAGVLMLLLYTVVTCGLGMTSLSPNLLAVEDFRHIERWVALAGNAVPIFFMLNFLGEYRQCNAAEEEGTGSDLAAPAFAAVALLTLVVVLVVGQQVARESRWTLAWQKKAPETNKMLARYFERRSYVNSKGDTLVYLFKEPLDYDPQNAYPLVVCLHGGPRRTRDVEVAQPAAFLIEPANQQKYAAFIFVPQGPPGHTWGGVPGLPSIDSLVFEALSDLEKRYAVDEKRRYVAGGSMGGYGVWHFIGTRPEVFAAAMPFCGGGDPALAGKMANVPVWAFHGRADRNVPVSASRTMVRAIRRSGAYARYTEFAGTGHNVWPEIEQTEGVFEWMFSQRRP